MATATIIRDVRVIGEYRKEIIATVTPVDGAHPAGGDALDLSAYFDDEITGAVQIGMEGVASNGYQWGMVLDGTTTALLTAYGTPAAVTGAVIPLAEATANLTALTTRWVIYGW